MRRLPHRGAPTGRAGGLCIATRQCQRVEKGVMCPSFRVTSDERHSTRHRAATLKAALNGEYGAHPFIGEELADVAAESGGGVVCNRDKRREVTRRGREAKADEVSCHDV